MVFNSTITNNSNLNIRNTVVYDYYFELNGTLDNSSVNLLLDFNVTLNINGTNNSYDAKVNQVLNYTSSNIGVFNLIATLDNQIETLVFNVTKIDSSLVVNNVSTEYNKNVTLSTRLIGDEGNGISGKTVSFYVNGQLVGTAITNNGGIAKLIYTLHNEGNFSWYAIFNGDNNTTNSISNNSSLIVSKSEAKFELSYDNKTGYLIAKLYYNLNIAGETINFYLNS